MANQTNNQPENTPHGTPSGATPAPGTEQDVRKFAPAAQRNRQPILDVLSRVLPGSGTILEIASGSGEHAVWFAQNLRPLIWQPSDPDPESRRSIAAHAAHARTTHALGSTLLPPLDLDVTAATWPIPQAAALVCNNMVHIAPWAASEGLMAGAARTLTAGGVLYLYGPYKRGGEHTAPSNADFDGWLRERNPAWGLRDLEAMVDLAAAAGFDFSEVVEMPANNLSLVFHRR